MDKSNNKAPKWSKHRRAEVSKLIKKLRFKDCWTRYNILEHIKKEYDVSDRMATNYYHTAMKEAQEIADKFDNTDVIEYIEMMEEEIQKENISPTLKLKYIEAINKLKGNYDNTVRVEGDLGVTINYIVPTDDKDDE
jgi:hypothetical protein